MRGDFLADEFAGPGAAFRFRAGELTPKHQAAFTVKLSKLMEEFAALCHQDAEEPKERTQSFGLLIACRHWVLGDMSICKR